MPLTHADLAASLWSSFRHRAHANGETGRPNPPNIKAGTEQAERHNFILRLVCLEAGEGAAERLEEDLEEQVTTDDIGLDGKAAYYEARRSVSQLDKEAEIIGEALLAVERFARAARRQTEALVMRRAFA